MFALHRHHQHRIERLGLDAQVRALGLPPRRFVTSLDATGCQRLDPRSLEALWRAAHRFAANGRSLVVRNAPAPLRRQLLGAGLASVLHPPRDQPEHRDT